MNTLSKQPISRTPGPASRANRRLLLASALSLLLHCLGAYSILFFIKPPAAESLIPAIDVYRLVPEEKQPAEKPAEKIDLANDTGIATSIAASPRPTAPPKRAGTAARPNAPLKDIGTTEATGETPVAVAANEEPALGETPGIGQGLTPGEKGKLKKLHHSSKPPFSSLGLDPPPKAKIIFIPKECYDGIDNDQDGPIDMKDSDCLKALDIKY